MKKLETPREIPDSPLYWSIEVPERGTFGFRTPFPIHAARILQALTDKGLLTFKEGMTLDTGKFDDAVDLWMLCGAAIGISWHDTNYNLETARKEFPTLQEYGEAVLEELHEEGWEMSDFRVLFPKVVQKMMASILTKQEVTERADFFDQTQGESS